MKLTTTSQNLGELFAISANLVPIPLIHTQIYPLIAKAILEAHTLNIFEEFVSGPKTVEDIVESTRLNYNALKSLLSVLTACNYLKCRNNRYSLTTMTKKWCLKKFSAKPAQYAML